MSNPRLAALADEIAGAHAVGGVLEARVHEALRGAGLPYAVTFGSVEAVLGLVEEALPGWAVSIEGTASRAHGEWTCALRRSLARDNDEAVGIAHGPSLAPVLLAALVRALAAGAHS